jgi:hypothetical protein
LICCPPVADDVDELELFDVELVDVEFVDVELFDVAALTALLAELNRDVMALAMEIPSF